MSTWFGIKIRYHILLASSLVISLHNPLFPSTHLDNAYTYGARYLLLCVVIASVVQDKEIDRWSEAGILVWPIQPRLWLTLW
jgi:hypothetical protein